jgi:hypothetical protein
MFESLSRDGFEWKTAMAQTSGEKYFFCRDKRSGDGSDSVAVAVSPR